MASNVGRNAKSASILLLDFVLDLSLDGSSASLRSLLVGSLALLSLSFVFDLAFLLGCCWSRCLWFLWSIRWGLRVTAGCLCLQLDAGDAVLDGQRVVFCIAGGQVSLTRVRLEASLTAAHHLSDSSIVDFGTCGGQNRCK